MLEGDDMLAYYAGKDGELRGKIDLSQILHVRPSSIPAQNAKVITFLSLFFQQPTQQPHAALARNATHANITLRATLHRAHSLRYAQHFRTHNSRTQHATPYATTRNTITSPPQAHCATTTAQDHNTCNTSLHSSLSLTHSPFYSLLTLLFRSLATQTRALHHARSVWNILDTFFWIEGLELLNSHT